MIQADKGIITYENKIFMNDVDVTSIINHTTLLNITPQQMFPVLGKSKLTSSEFLIQFRKGKHALL